MNPNNLTANPDLLVKLRIMKDVEIILLFCFLLPKGQTYRATLRKKDLH